MSEVIDIQQYPFELDQCPACHSFAWSFDDTAILADEPGANPDLDQCRCDDCDHTWLVPSLPFTDIDDATD